MFGGPCCVANIAGGKSGIVEFDDAVAGPRISDDDGVVAGAEHRQVAARVDETAVAAGRAKRHDRAVHGITLGNAAEIDVQRPMRDHRSRRCEF